MSKILLVHLGKVLYVSALLRVSLSALALFSTASDSSTMSSEICSLCN